MTRLADRPEDCCCEGCWDAKPVPGLERDFYVCDYHGSPDYGHVVHYRHACERFSQGDRGEDLFLKPAAARLELGVTPDREPSDSKDSTLQASDFDSVTPFWVRWLIKAKKRICYPK